MSPLLVVLAVACAVLVLASAALAAALVVALRRRAEQESAHATDLATLREQVEQLGARQRSIEDARGPQVADPADYVITFDQTDPIQVSTGRVVNAALGEPLIKAAALGHGVREALREERRAHLAFQVRRDYKRRRKATRAAARAAARRAR